MDPLWPDQFDSMGLSFGAALRAPQIGTATPFRKGQASGGIADGDLEDLRTLWTVFALRQEHLRPAESSELGALPGAVHAEGPMERIDDDGVDDEEIFHDASNLMEDGDVEAYRKQKRQWPDGVPRRRMRQKGPAPYAVEDDKGI